MYRLSWFRIARVVSTAIIFIGVAAALSACSSGITLFNNAGPAPYGQPGGAMPTSLPMPPQPFVGNQLAAAQTAAAQRPTYVYLPAPMPYQGAGYGAPQYAAQPQYTKQARYVAPKKARARRMPRVLNVKKSSGPVHTASVSSARIRQYSNKNNQQGRLVIVRAGDTLYGLARRHNININHLKAVNNFRGSHVTVGQKLFIPAPGSHYRSGKRYRAAPALPPRRDLTIAHFINGNTR